ncbi:hypothetical protein [Pseudomonas aeruginosa]
MSSIQHQLIEQCVTRLRSIVEALDNIHDNTPHRWSTDLDDVHSSAESLLALINDQAPPSDAERWKEQFACMQLQRDHHRERADAALARVAELTATRNRYGVDAHYFNKNLQRILRDFESFTPDELARSLIILAKVADEKVVAQHSVPDGAADLCRFLAKLYCELDGLRYSTAKLPAEQIADALIFKWPVLQGARNQLNIKRISEQPYDESKLHSAIAAMLAAAPGKEVPQAWIDVQEERRRQITAEGWTPEHDDEHADGQMAQAAGCYALHAGGIGTDWPDGRQNGSALFWPWDKDSWKPTTPRRDLVKACALALAEIERLDRAGISQSPQPGATTASS